MIELKNLNKFYNNGKNNQLHVLKNVTLTLPEKGMVAVFGRSGCGKTTLLNVIGGLDSYASGKITVNGKPLKENIDRLRNGDMGYVFQNYYLNYENNCFDNVADALRLCGIKDEKTLEEQTLHALSLVGMEKYALRLPGTLSGGQQQRIAIARAIVKSPKIILADEPTGNLDEANTILVMDLLKKLSKDRLVLLVTHEADLVDHYCDRVVEIADGRIVGVKENKDANGLAAKKKNHIYLGELVKHSEEGAHAKIEFYGDLPPEELHLRIVNEGGKTYLQVLSEGIQILDEKSETKLFDGVFEKAIPLKEENDTEGFDLPRIPGSNYGKLFTFGSSLLLGYKIHFTKMRKKGQRLLVFTLLLLSLILVMTVASFGTAFSDLAKINSSYNKNTFWLDTENAEDYSILQNAVGLENSAIDYVFRTNSYYRSPSLFISPFKTGSNGIDLGYETDPLLSEKMIDESDLLCGRMTQNSSEILLSKITADRILEQSTVSFVEEYADLLHTRVRDLDAQGSSLTVVGIVNSNEPAFYANEMTLAKQSSFAFSFLPASEYGLNIAKGEALLYLPIKAELLHSKHPSVGDKVYLNGTELTLSRVVTYEEISQNSKGNIHSFGIYNEKDDGYLTLYTPFMTDYTDNGAGFFVSDEDFIAAIYQSGQCSSGSISNSNTNDYAYLEDQLGYGGGVQLQRILIHSTSPKLTRAYLKNNFGDAVNKGLVTDPAETKNMLSILDGASIVSKIISMSIFAAIISVCIYFIMRSSLMGRVKEIGIYRAIGVSKSNLLYRFFGEAVALSSLTVGAGTLLTSALMFFWLERSPLMETMFFYPWWLSVLVFLGVMGVSILFGILPVLFLLMKTPSAILAKYDI